jgi:hypothetical protein
MAEPSPENERAQPQAQPQASSQPQPSSSSDKGDWGGRGRGEAYIPLPDGPKEPPKKSRWPLIAALIAALAVGGAAVYKTKTSQAPASPPAAAATEKVFVVTEADRDAEALAFAKEVLARDGKTGELAAAAEQAKKERAAPVPGTPLSPAKEKERQIVAALAAAPEGLRQSVVDGGAGFYTFRFQETRDEGGDVFEIAVDGVAVARVTTSPQLQTLTIPLDPKTQHTITETLIFARDRRVYEKGAPERTGPAPTGRAALGVSSSKGEMRATTMETGQSESWTVRMGGL